MNLDYANIKEQNLADDMDRKNVHDFVTVNSRSVKDHGIFMSWRDDFKSRKIPYVVTHDVKPRSDGSEEVWMTIWSEEIAPPMRQDQRLKKPKIIFDAPNLP